MSVIVYLVVVSVCVLFAAMSVVGLEPKHK